MKVSHVEKFDTVRFLNINPQQKTCSLSLFYLISIKTNSTSKTITLNITLKTMAEKSKCDCVKPDVVILSTGLALNAMSVSI